MFDSVHQSKPKDMIAGVHELLSEADVVCHYNGTRFDIPTLNREFFMYEMNPPDGFKQLDLLKTARQQFRFASNKLDFIAQQLGIGSKTHHKGMELWKDCMDGCDKAWAIMRRYNIQDVRLLERLYKRILPWIKSHPNWGVYLDSDRPTCRNCGSTTLKKNGVYVATTLTYQRWRCLGCGTELRSRTTRKKAPEGITL